MYEPWNSKYKTLLIIIGIPMLYVLFVSLFPMLYPEKSPMREEAEISAKEPEESLVLLLPPQEEIELTCQRTEYFDYYVKKGDTLWNIAEQYLGNPQDYRRLAEWNAVENADLIYPGQLLRLPLEVTDTILRKNDWFYQHDIPIQPQGSFSVPVLLQNIETGAMSVTEDVPVTVQLRSMDLDFKRSGYQLIEAVFETDVENIPFSESRLYYYFEVADRYTGVSFIQSSTLVAENAMYAVKIYELAIKDAESGYEGTVDVVHSSVNNRITIQAEVPKEYDGLVFGFGEYIEIDHSKYDADTLYTLDQFDIEGTEQYYFSLSGY